ncbi:MAG TPA: ABC transporter permease [Bryobacteraceae bacterium]|jgi:predicted permease|nr:ABC transporter permease [Bryobacteraceae bacterium]
MQNLVADLRYAARQFRLSPIFSLTAILTLALGIGGTTAIFSLIHRIMVRSLPVADPASLYRIGDGTDCCVEGGPQDRWGMFSYPFFQIIQANAPEFQELTAFQAAGHQMSVRRQGTEHFGRSVRSEFVTGNYFDTFGIRSFAGRVLSPADDRAAAVPVGVLSYQAWKAFYGGDPSVIGSTFVVEDHPITVIGIAPPGFYGETLRSSPPDLWLPLQQEPLINGKNSLLHQAISSWLRVIGRARPGANVAPVAPRLTALLRGWLQNDAGFPAVWIPEIVRLLPRQTIAIVPAGSGVAAMKEDYGRSLEILLVVCGMVLLIACANVANLMLARAMARRGQTALCLAMGASRSRIIAQSLTESVFLSLAGFVAGLIVADAVGRLLLNLAFHSNHLMALDNTPSLPILGFALALSLLTAILFGAAPAWFATRTDPIEALRGANRSTRDSSSISRKVLLVLQATIAVVLVAGAAMLTRSLSNLENQDFGFETAHRIEINLNSPPATYSVDRLNALYPSLERHLLEIPGVENAGLAMYNPLTDNWGEQIVVDGHPKPTFSDNSNSSWDRVSTTYFQALGQRVLRGRPFNDADNSSSTPVAVVNETFVHRFFPHEDPMGKRFGMDLPENARTFQIVGIARDAKYTDPQNPVRPMFYVPLLQSVRYANPLMDMLEIRSHYIGGALIESRLDAGVLEPMIKKALGETDPNLTIIGVRTLKQEVDLSFDQQRAVSSLAALFGAVALLLAAIGLYGVTAYSVAQRTGEIGVRMALGADRGSVIRMVLNSAFRKVAIGLILGIPLSIGAGRLISSQLYDVAGWDPLALTAAILSLGFAAFLAALIPATRASSIDPIQALRVE